MAQMRGILEIARELGIDVESPEIAALLALPEVDAPQARQILECDRQNLFIAVRMGNLPARVVPYGKSTRTYFKPRDLIEWQDKKQDRFRLVNAEPAARFKEQDRDRA